MPNHSLKYSALPGYFEHDEQPEGPQFRATTLPGFGLLNRRYNTDGDTGYEQTQWERFMHFLKHLNKEANGQARYKLIFVIRHGQGFHNIKEAQVGRAEWEARKTPAKWALLDGDDETTWVDAKLTEKGKSQALEIKAMLERDIREMKIPLPGKSYTSPLARCLETTRLAFSGLQWPRDEPFKPIIKEALRERLGRHTCDRRSTRSWIESNYDQFEIESGFTEQDELWQQNYRETLDEHVVRVRQLLDDIINSDERHKEVWVAAGAMVPLLVVATPQ
ncbi:phosphoglycerate mutase [Trichoderma harzianum]|uniref:Phosphoglycerate mutase n=1 Tax=Trichoderma harzianum TaxID=5544 RepID=A0A0F9ZW65_TRIHA|nr:phosphoglycerate mutase [Trichoderma harzianum]